MASNMSENVRNLMSSALEHQRAGRFTEAEALCRAVLRIAPDEAACLHMLGVICVKTSRAREAVAQFLRAGTVTDWKIPAVSQNLGLALHLLYGDAITIKRIAYKIWCRKLQSRVLIGSPLVSVIIPSYNHAGFIEECLESVYRQTWRNIELIVIDDGSTDASVERIRCSLASCPFPNRFIARENRGAHATINEAIDLAQGDFVNVLNSDDRFTANRIENMVRCVAGAEADWGFSAVALIDATGQAPAVAPGSMAEHLYAVMATMIGAPTVGFALLQANVAISTGNIFVRKAFFKQTGGFSELRYNHDREFVLRSTLLSEPVYVPETLYEYRLHQNNTISESSPQPEIEANSLIANHAQRLLTDEPTPNIFAPTRANWGEYALSSILRFGFGRLVSTEHLLAMARMVTSNPAHYAESLFSAPLESLVELQEVNPILKDMRLPPAEPFISFDQYQRYGMVALAIEKMRGVGQVFSILEVGANSHMLLGKLLPRDQITYLDLEIPEDMRGANNVIVGDATDLALPDCSFDIVVSLDVFEHVTPERRDLFLRHTTRVARDLTLIAAPFDSQVVRDAEAAASVYWNSLFRDPYRWLQEHQENGLPDLSLTKIALTELGVGHCSFGHGRLDLWCAMMKAHFATAANPDLRTALVTMDRYYREHLFENDFDTGAVYRQFLFCSRSTSILAQMRMFCDRYLKAPPRTNLQPVFDILNAMQQITNQPVKESAR